MKIVKGFLFFVTAGFLALALSGCEALSGPSGSSDQSITKIDFKTDPVQTTASDGLPSNTTETTSVPKTSEETHPSPGTTEKTTPSPETTEKPTPSSATTEKNTPPPTPEVVDVTPPTVTGKDFSVTQGDSVSYKKHITVSDDMDENPTIKVDNSAVDLDTPGVYPVIYTVTDKSGNSTVLTLMLTVKEKGPDKAATEEYVLYLARQILDDITDDSMSDLQVAYSIYRWSKRNIGYINTSDKSSWIVGAYDAFTKRQGDCFNYFAASKALLTAAGIENVDVVRAPSPVRKSTHYWSLVNVGDGWYHFDSTPFVFKESNFFMLTDKEIHAWDSKYYRGEHDYNPEGLPEVATKSIQSIVDYNSSKLKE